jgi:hypothetical protein
MGGFVQEGWLCGGWGAEASAPSVGICPLWPNSMLQLGSYHPRGLFGLRH